MISIRVYPHTSANIKGDEEKSLGQLLHPVQSADSSRVWVCQEYGNWESSLLKSKRRRKCAYIWVLQRQLLFQQFRGKERYWWHAVFYLFICQYIPFCFWFICNTHIIQLRVTFPNICIWIVTCTVISTLASLTFPFLIHAALLLCWDVPSFFCFTCGSELVMLFLLWLLLCHPWALQIFRFSGSREVPVAPSQWLQLYYSTWRHWRQFLLWIYPDDKQMLWP